MRIDDIFAQAKEAGRTPVSFEMFPPKGELTLDRAREAAGALSALSPDFISVTCSAGGGGNFGQTAAIAHMIEDEFGVSSVVHLTCMSLTREQLAARVEEYRAAGVHNVLALRGDRPTPESPAFGAPSDYAYAA